jgi:urease accessory protein
MRNTDSDSADFVTARSPRPDTVHQPHQHIAQHRVYGRLRLGFERRASDGSTVLSACEQRPPLKVVRAFTLSDGAALAHLHNVSGGVLGGDRLETRVEVGRGASAQLTTTGATRLYRCGDGARDAAQLNEVIVGEGGLLEYLPDALIPFAGSRFRQETRVELEPGAGLFWWEAVAPGREARGESFDYERLELKLEIGAAGRVIALERSCLEPRVRPPDSPARLGGYRYFASFYVCRVGLSEARWFALESELSEVAARLSRAGEAVWGVSVLPAHGLLVRAVAVNGREIAPGLFQFWRDAKRQLYGREAVMPRKIY